MALIRQANARDIARDAIVLDLSDVQRQAEFVVDGARRRAESIAAEARAERERILAGAADQGRQEGKAQGLAEGRKAGAEEARATALQDFRARFDLLHKGWTAALSDFESRRDRILAEARVEVLRLAVMIAERVVKRSVELDPQIIAAQLDAVLALVIRPTELVVSINPDDRAAAEKSLPALLARFEAVRHVGLVDDPALVRGSCVAKTRGAADGATETSTIPGGEIDASIPTQLQRIVDVLLPPLAPAAGPAGDSAPGAGSPPGPGPLPPPAVAGREGGAT
jgi:flagellar assembly protein FliH